MSSGELGPQLQPFERRTRCAIALVAALLTAIRNYLWRSGPAVEPSDFGQVWFAARAILDGANPYELIGPGLAYDWPGHFYYPLPAAILAIPFAPLSMAAADAAFGAISAGVLTWLFTRYGLTGLLMLVSPSVLLALQLGQWSPLFTSALLLPGLGVLFVAKPTIGAAMFAARPTWWPLLGGFVVLLLASAVQPSWVGDWLEALRTTDVIGGGAIPYKAPVLRTGGVLLLLSLLRWRRPEARLVAALACVPQTSLLYETLPLLLVAKRRAHVVWFVGAGYVVTLLGELDAPHATVGEAVGAYGPYVFWLMYIPAMIMVLVRPNEGYLPAWLERTLVRWRVPSRVRGTAPRCGA